jgi:hypothetical protein
LIIPTGNLKFLAGQAGNSKLPGAGSPSQPNFRSILQQMSVCELKKAKDQYFEKAVFPSDTGLD